MKYTTLHGRSVVDCGVTAEREIVSVRERVLVHH